MISLKKGIKKRLSELAKPDGLHEGTYASAAALLNSNYVFHFVTEFNYSDSHNLTDEDYSVADNIIKISKALYDVNWTRVGILFKLLPDRIYDDMLEKFKAHKGNEPFQSHIPSGIRAVDHDYPELVGTLDKAYDIYDITDKMSVEKFLRRVTKEFGVKKLRLAISPKYDGSSVSVTYTTIGDKARPVRATSRGDFENNKGVDMSGLLEGREDITLFERVAKDNRYQFGIQYEAIATERDRLNLSEITGVNYSTRRAAIAAAIKRVVNANTSSDERAKINDCISLVPINISDNLVDQHGETWEFTMAIFGHMMGYGDINHTVHYIEGKVKDILVEFQDLVLEYVEKRPSLPYSIDGLVISVVNEDIRRGLGRHNNRNRWQIAYKFGALVQRTKVTGILTTQGNMGYLGHNITFDPIEFNGVKYDKAPVNNITRFEGLDLRIGDEVLVSYNADVMGYIYKDETCKPNKKGEKIKLPENCVNCNEPLTVDRDMLKCTNDDCSGQAFGRLSEVIRILDIDFIGEETVQSLVDIGITNAIEFIKMDRETLAKVLTGKNLDKVYTEIKDKIAREIDYSKVIDMLRIPSLRTKTAKKIIDYIGSDALLKLMTGADYDTILRQLRKVPGINKNATVFAKGLSEKANLFFELLGLLNVSDIKPKEYDSIVLISGFRSNKEFEELCEELNYGITDSGKYDILVATPDRLNGSKANRARKSGKPIYTVSEFIERFSKK